MGSPEQSVSSRLKAVDWFLFAGPGVYVMLVALAWYVMGELAAVVVSYAGGILLQWWSVAATR